MTRKLILLLFCATLTFSSIFAADSNEPVTSKNNSFMLLNVISDGAISARDLVFTNLETDEEIWFRNLLRISRLGTTHYLMQELPAGEYYLSGIYPTINGNESASRIRVNKSSGTIVIVANTINYIGDVIIKSRETGRGITTEVDYQPNSATLMSAAAREPATFKSMDTVVSIAGNKPVPVDKRLLGL
ncbi:MAG: hypothetical protein COA96_09090 [SAR86 cluster bacterium]|uniref:Carboxypeptidase regulatory-like domain-containing protein n=1 Tax=SAR86 cluster bacterium TaxID=2030880 RepID=A0A2A5B0Q7_9GAMM|nr:MAG: hypothetical protein COA96_09090 [SAR86 cluster bacterium]